MQRKYHGDRLNKIKCFTKKQNRICIYNIRRVFKVTTTDIRSTIAEVTAQIYISQFRQQYTQSIHLAHWMLRELSKNNCALRIICWCTSNICSWKYIIRYDNEFCHYCNADLFNSCRIRMRIKTSCSIHDYRNAY